MIREDFLQQNAYHEVDTYCPYKKQYEMLRIMLKCYHLMREAIEKGIDFEMLKNMKTREAIARMATVPNEEWEEKFKQIEQEMEKEFEDLMKRK